MTTYAAHITDNDYDREIYLGVTGATLTAYILDNRPETLGGPNPGQQSWSTSPCWHEGGFFGGQWGNGCYGSWHEFEVEVDAETVEALTEIAGTRLDYHDAPGPVREIVRELRHDAQRAEDQAATAYAAMLLDEAATTLRDEAAPMLALIEAGDRAGAAEWWDEHGGWGTISFGSEFEGLAIDDDGRLCVIWGEDNLEVYAGEDAKVINTAATIIRTA